jgi:hypothetical protein
LPGSILTAKPGPERATVLTCSAGDSAVDMRVRHQETDDEEESVQRGADQRRAAGAGERGDDGGGRPPARAQRADLLSLEGAVQRHGSVGLEDENRRLKKLLAEAMLDVAALKDLLAKN